MGLIKNSKDTPPPPDNRNKKVEYCEKYEIKRQDREDKTLLSL